MTAPASQRSTIRPRWGQLLMICPIWPVLWTYFGDVSISTSFLNMFRPAVAQREQMAQAVRFDELIWANLEEIGYAE